MKIPYQITRFRKKVIILTISIILLIAIGFYLTNKNSKTGYIQLQKVYDEFNCKTELEMKLKRTEEARQQILDSLFTQIAILNKKVKDETSPDKKIVNQLTQLKHNYNTLNDKFINEQQYQEDKYVKQIWDQINTYVSNYGKEFGYTYIYGAGGRGGLMYADESKDITNEVIEYINKQYEGK